MAHAGARAGSDGDQARKAVQAWVRDHKAVAAAAVRTIDDIEQSGGSWSFAKLTIANAALRELAQEAMAAKTSASGGKPARR